MNHIRLYSKWQSCSSCTKNFILFFFSGSSCSRFEMKEVEFCANPSQFFPLLSKLTEEARISWLRDYTLFMSKPIASNGFWGKNLIQPTVIYWCVLRKDDDCHHCNQVVKWCHQLMCFEEKNLIQPTVINWCVLRKDDDCHHCNPVVKWCHQLMCFEEREWLSSL